MPCREHLAQLRERQDQIDRLGASVLVVTFEPPDQVARFSRAEKLPYPILSDPSRRAYAAFGLQRGTLAQTLSWNAMRSYLSGLLRGRWPRPPHGDLFQLGGDFVLDGDGWIVFAHRSQETADRPPVDRLLAAVRSVAAQRGSDASADG